MFHALLLLLSVLMDYQTLTDLSQGAFTMGVASLSLFGAIGTALAVRRRKFVRG